MCLLKSHWRMKLNISTHIQNIETFPKAHWEQDHWPINYPICWLTPLESHYLIFWNKLKTSWTNLEKSLMLWVLHHQHPPDKSLIFWWLWSATSLPIIRTRCQENTSQILRNKLQAKKSVKVPSLKESSDRSSKTLPQTITALMIMKMITLKCQSNHIKVIKLVVSLQWNVSALFWSLNCINLKTQFTAFWIKFINNCFNLQVNLTLKYSKDSLICSILSLKLPITNLVIWKNKPKIFLIL